MAQARMTSPLRLVFMGTPDFSVPTLEALLAAGHQVVAVMSQPARPAGRGQMPRPSAVAARAEAARLPVFTPKSLKDPAEVDKLRTLQPDAIVVVAYGLILPKAVLDIPRLGCLNVHASLLPRWRGATPIQRAIEAGDAITGVTIMQMAEGLDTGPMLACAETAIGAADTAATLHDRLAGIGAALLVDALGKLAAGQITPTPQPAAGVTYARKIDKAEARIDWSQPAATVARRIQAFAPFPGAWFTAKGERVKALGAEVAEGHGAAPGQVIADPLVVACGSGAVALTRLQRPGKNVQDTHTFLRGFALPPGSLLE